MVRNRAFLGLKKFGRDAEFQRAGAFLEPGRVDGGERGFADGEIPRLGQAEEMAHGGAEIGFMAHEQHR